jgi:hypothetical protein
MQGRWPLFVGVHNPKFIVDCLHQVLLHAEIFLSGLDGGVAQQHLDLLEVAAGLAA